MKRWVVWAVLTLVIGASSTAPVCAWGPQGHQAIGDVARRLLTPKARAAVVKILGSDDLGAASTWADDVRSAASGRGPLAGDAEAARINRDFPTNASWHYVNLPLGLPAYPRGRSPFTSAGDVVHAIDRCAQILKTHGAASEGPLLSQAEALKYLIHLVGDVHQPLHVGCGYYRVDAAGRAHLVTSPSDAAGLPNDRGGNALFFGDGRGDELHACWDYTIVQRLAGTKDAHGLAAKIAPLVQTTAWRDHGSCRDWPMRWATDTLHVARAAYAGFTVGKAVVAPDRSIKRIDIDFDSDKYQHSHEALAAIQLAKAGYRLAEILNRLYQ